MKVQVPSVPSPNTTIYDNLKGVDYSVDSSQVDKRRTPDGANFIPDEGGNPEKRKGWSVLHTDIASKVDNLWTFEIDDVRYLLCTYGTTLVEFDDTNIYTANAYTMNSAGKKIGLYSQSPGQEGFYIFDDSELIVADVSGGRIAFTKLDPTVLDDVFTPTVVIARDPVNGGGVLYDNINKLTRWRRENFINSGSTVGSGWSATAATDVLTSATGHNLAVDDAVKFDVGTGVLPAPLDPAMTYYVKTVPSSTTITISATKGGATFDITSAGTAGWGVLSPSLTFLLTAIPVHAGSTLVTATYLDENGVWQSATVSSVSGATVTLSARYLGETEDNVIITYYASGSGSAEQVCRCKQWARYNLKVEDQIFVSASEASGYGQYIFYSDNGDITYFPDQNYVYVGGSGSKIAGFLNVGENLAVIKEDNANEATVFFLYETTITVLNSDGTETELNTFGSKQTAAGVGAIGSCMGVLIDEPMFLAPTGIYGIASQNYTSEKVVRNRSKFVNSKLTVENNLEEAVSIVTDNKFMVFVNSHVYILDGNQKTRDSDTNSYVYECYYWTNVPATSVVSYGKNIYFSGVVGNANAICKFNTSESSSSYSDNGSAIVSTWSTPYDNDNGTQFFKVTQKKGTMCTTKPYAQSSVKIYFAADGEPREYVGEATVNLSGFGDIDFGNWSFIGSAYPQDKFFNKKKKKYKRLQIILENAENEQGFGIIEIVKTWYPTRYAK